MKFVPQGVFDACTVLLLREANRRGEIGLNETLQQLVRGYLAAYPDDNAFGPQLLQAVGSLAAYYASRVPKRFDELLTRVMELRMELDDDMKRRTKLNKVFAGSVFNRGHPAPQLRVIEAEAHVKYLVEFISQLPPLRDA